VVCFRLLDYLSEDLGGKGEPEAWQHPESSTKAIPLFKGVTSTNIVGGIPLLRAPRVLRASLSSPHYPSDKAILNGLIRVGFEIRKKHRTVATVVTEVYGPSFSVRRSVRFVRRSTRLFVGVLPTLAPSSAKPSD
jgi:hypothetical protein